MSLKAAKGWGSEELRDLYERFAPAVYHRALSILGRDADAWDAVQEVFSRILVNNAQFRGESRPMTYVYRVTTNVSLNLLRSRLLREPRAEVAPPAEPTVGLEGSDAAQFLRVLAAHLSERELRIAVLYFVDGLKQEEIADVLELSRKTIGRELDAVRTRAESLAQAPAGRVSGG